MQAASRRRSGFLLSTIALTTLALSGCAGEADTPAEVIVKRSTNPMIKPCDAYVSQAEVYQFCVYEHARHLPNIGGVELTCPLAGPWESDCRNAWVLSQMTRGNRDLDVLLRGCGENSSCFFDVFEVIKAEDLLGQLERCDTLESNLGYHCREHALELWRVEKHSAEEVNGGQLVDPVHSAPVFQAGTVKSLSERCAALVLFGVTSHFRSTSDSSTAEVVQAEGAE